MTGPEYQSALTTLSLTPDQAASWLGIGRSTAYRYLKTGCGGAVERALTERLETAWLVRTCASLNPDAGEIGAGMLAQIVSEARRIQSVRHSDLTAAVGLPG